LRGMLSYEDREFTASAVFRTQYSSILAVGGPSDFLVPEVHEMAEIINRETSAGR
jgi:hypothetical protein